MDAAKDVLNVNPKRTQSPWCDEHRAEAICAKKEERQNKSERKTSAAEDHYKK